MDAPLRRLCAFVWFGLPLLALLPAGCGQPVREDRSINWSNEGQSVGFQHGEDGIFLADKDSGKLTKIFQPGSDVLATSSPLWSPKGKCVIFTAARAAAGQQSVSLPPILGDANDPAGKVFLQQPINYSCYLYEDTGADPPAKPTELFVAGCDHIGYVAANQAVRWHPSGERVLYINQIANGKHGLFEYDLATKKSRGVLSCTADCLIFDWTPDGSKLVCVLGNKEPNATDGIWIGQLDGNDFLHVPNSDQLAAAELPSVLEQLRATRPAWTPDGTHFAFPTYTPGKTKDDPGRSYLRLGGLVPPTVETLAEGVEPFRDLRWTPDGARLGVVRGGDNASLHIAQKGAALSAPINRRPVRQFVGWNGAGNRLAYIVPAGKPVVESEEWALLLLPDDRARDAVYVADGAGNEPGLEVFSGMRVTYPQWSPTEDKLSLWVTFTPTHHSWVSLFLGGALRPGDPAAIFDATTGHFTWMAVNPHEKMQVGHYYLSKHEYLLAWRWYEKAEAEWPAAKPADAGLSLNTLRQFSEPRDFLFFQYYCLTKLGRNEEAEAKLAAFRKTFPPRAEQFKGLVPVKGADEDLRQILDPDGVFSLLLRDLYCAQVFLSVDAAEDGDAFFREELKAAATDAARLSSSLVLGQILLLEHKHTDYAVLLTDTIAPLLLKLMKPLPPETDSTLKNLQPFVEMILMFAQLPLCDPQFVGHISKEDIAALVPRWELLRTKADGETNRREVDLILYAAYQRLGKEQERKAAALRLWNNQDGPPANEDIGKTMAEMRRNLKALSQR